MAIDVYLPSLPSMTKHFCTTEYKAQLIIIVFYCGAVFSRLFWGPFSDLFGRKKSILIAYLIQAIFQILCLSADDIDNIIIYRALQSLGSGVTGVLGTALIADYYDGNERAKILNWVELSFIIAFIVAPSVGVVLNEFFGWKGGFVFIFISFIFSFILFYSFLPQEKNTAQFSIKSSINHFLNSYKNVVNIKILTYSLLSGVSAGTFMAYALKAPFVYLTRFSSTSQEYIVFQMLPFVVTLIISIFYKKIVDKFSINFTINYSNKILLGLGVLSALFASEVLIVNKFCYFFLVLCTSVATSFLITGGTSLALHGAVKKGAVASVSSSIRSAALFFIMYASSRFDATHNQIFFLFPILAIIIYFLWYKIRNFSNFTI